MAQVTVTIDGKAYRMACDEGQEEHLLGLSHRFDSYVTHLKGAFGEIGDNRLLVMAAVMVMDELAELERRLDDTSMKLAASESARAKTETLLSKGGTETEHVLEQIAERLEGLTAKINAAPA